jgi:hypothetical protein
VTSGDFNGKLDLAVAQDYGVSVFLNKGLPVSSR